MVNASEEPACDNVLVNWLMNMLVVELTGSGNGEAIVVEYWDTSAVMAPVDETVETRVAAEVDIAISDVISSTDVAGVLRISRVNKDVMVSVCSVVTGIKVLYVSCTLAEVEKEVS